MKKILFIIKNKNEASSRFRVKAYLPYLQNDFDYKIFYSEYNNHKVPKFLRSFIKRYRFLKLLINIKKFDIIFMQRPMSSDKKESIFFEKLLSFLNNNIIFDYDDALFIQNENKIKKLIKISKKVICGNDYLAEFSKRYNKNTYIIPTTIDTNKFTPKKTANNSNLILGWTGTSGNYENFSDELINSIKKILDNYKNVSFLFICDKKPPKKFNFKYEFIQWNEKNEILDLKKIDIGLMPLIDSPWTKGKCGFKLIQYGAISIASIASNVGVNNQVVLNNKTGFLINNETQWYEKIKILIEDEKLRQTFGRNARKHILQNYDTKKNYISLKNILNS